MCIHVNTFALNPVVLSKYFCSMLMQKKKATGGGIEPATEGRHIERS